MTDHETTIRNQIRYYRDWAADYDQAWPAEQFKQSTNDIRQALSDFSPTGDFLEIACGTGNWTRELTKHADRIEALDASPEMLAINAEKLGNDSKVRYVNADFFEWQPDSQYDVVFFSFWLSHVPPPLFESFWTRVAKCLEPGGRVFFIDETPHGMWHEEYVDEGRAIVRRQAKNGTDHQLVKVFWTQSDIKSALDNLGWNVTVSDAGPLFWGPGDAAFRRRLQRKDDARPQSPRN